jgi:two-component system CheB/CheR fusion protein
MNEELQSTNEELETINDELRQRSDELNQVNGFLESILSSLRAGVAVADSDLRILAWSDRAADLWGLFPDEVRGQHLLNLDFGLPLDDVVPMMRDVIAERVPSAEQTIEATNRRGRRITCRVNVSRLAGQEGDVRGAILLMEEWDGAQG